MSNEFDSAVLKCFLKKQLQLFPEKVAEDEDEAEEVQPTVEGQDETIDEGPVKSQKDIFADLTGQKRLFEDDSEDA